MTKRLTHVGEAPEFPKAVPILHDRNSPLPLADRLETALARIEAGLESRTAASAADAARHTALKAAAAETVAALDAMVGNG